VTATQNFAIMRVVDVSAVPPESRQSTDHERARLAAIVVAGFALAAGGAFVLSEAVLKLVAVLGLGP
jgi:hypothetical protein